MQFAIEPLGKRLLDDAVYCPGSWCQFCKAAVKCRARADAKLQLAKYEFAQPPLLSDAEIGDILSKLEDLK